MVFADCCFCVHFIGLLFIYDFVVGCVLVGFGWFGCAAFAVRWCMHYAGLIF